MKQHRFRQSLLFRLNKKAHVKFSAKKPIFHPPTPLSPPQAGGKQAGGGSVSLPRCIGIFNVLCAFFLYKRTKNSQTSGSGLLFAAKANLTAMRGIISRPNIKCKRV